MESFTSIVILSYNTFSYTRQCVESIRQYTPRGSYELIVIDNGSTDGSVPWLRAQPYIRCVCNKENLGFPGGCNQGMKMATGTEILLLNSDTIVTRGWLENLRRALYSDEKIGAVSCMTNYCSNWQKIDISYQSIAEMQEFASDYHRRQAGKWKKWLTLVGFCFLLRYEVYQKLGGLDERFHPGGYEDDDYSFRIREAGYELLLCEDTFIHHFGSASFLRHETPAEEAQRRAAFLALNERNKKWFLEKWQTSELYKVTHKMVFNLSEKTKPDSRILLVDCDCGMDLYVLAGLYPKAGITGVTRNPLGIRLSGHSFPMVLCQENFQDIFQQVHGQYDAILFLSDIKDLAGAELFFQKFTETFLAPAGMLYLSDGEKLYCCQADEERRISKDGILFLTHDLGGGAQRFLEQSAGEYAGERTAYCLKPFKDKDSGEHGCVFFALERPEQKHIVFSTAELNDCMEKFHIREIFVNHLFGYTLPFMLEWIRSTSLPYRYFVHDYYCLCPHSLLTCRQRYCQTEQKELFCREKFEQNCMPEVSLKEYQAMFQTFLQGAEAVYVPSSYAAAVIRHRYPTLILQLRPHKLAMTFQHTFQQEFAQEEELTILFPGLMSEAKGASHLQFMQQLIEKKLLPIRLVVLGDYPAMEGKTSGGIRITGAYKAEQISSLLERYHTAIVAVLSNCPETYCYTASEAILSGYPVLSWNIGAHAKRIVRHDCGWVLPLEHAESALARFLDFISSKAGRQSVLEKAQHTKRFCNGME